MALDETIELPVFDVIRAYLFEPLRGRHEP
jgi:hypothetical protein